MVSKFVSTGLTKYWLKDLSHSLQSSLDLRLLMSVAVKKIIISRSMQEMFGMSMGEMALKWHCMHSRYICTNVYMVCLLIWHHLM